MLKELLEQVSDTYPDFVHGILLIAKREKIEADIEKYINDHIQADSSAISEYIFDVLLKDRASGIYQER